MARPSSYPSELRKRAVRMLDEVRGGYRTEPAVINAVVAKLGIGSRETLRKGSGRWAASRCAGCWPGSLRRVVGVGVRPLFGSCVRANVPGCQATSVSRSMALRRFLSR